MQRNHRAALDAFAEGRPYRDRNLTVTVLPDGGRVLTHYATPILFRPNLGALRLNARKYSNTTTRLQNTIRFLWPDVSPVDGVAALGIPSSVPGGDE